MIIIIIIYWCHTSLNFYIKSLLSHEIPNLVNFPSLNIYNLLLFLFNDTFFFCTSTLDSFNNLSLDHTVCLYPVFSIKCSISFLSTPYFPYNLSSSYLQNSFSFSSLPHQNLDIVFISSFFFHLFL